MSTEILRGQGRVNDLGELVLPLNDEIGRAVFFKEFFKSSAGQKIRPLLTKVAEKRVAEVAALSFGEEAELTIPQLMKVVEDLLAVKDPDIIPPTPEPAPEVERPRDGQGRFLSEYEIWANDQRRSMTEIRQRAQQDPEGFGRWYSEQRSVEGQTQGYTVLNAPTRSATEADRQVLGEFARAYNATPAALLKPLNGLITVADKRYTKDQFDSLVSRAVLSGLL
jgi:hypothetical protein